MGFMCTLALQIKTKQKQGHSEGAKLLCEFGPYPECVSEVRIRVQEPNDFRNLMGTSLSKDVSKIKLS